MTTAELNAVRILRARLIDAERWLEYLEQSKYNTTRGLTGMPHSPLYRGNVIFQIIATHEEISELKKLIAAKRDELESELAKFLDGDELNVMILRYVDCKNFRDIELALELSDAEVFYHHAAACEKILTDVDKARQIV